MKCDEARPACDKCTATGRNCDGYESPDPTRRPSPNRRLLPSKGFHNTHSLILPQPPTGSPDIQASDVEQRAFNYFRFVGAAALWIISPAKEWIRLALQLSLHEPAVFYAITAFATDQEAASQGTMNGVLEQPSRERCLGGRWKGNRNLAEAQMCKATSSLSRYIDHAIHRNASVEPVLMCCILFTCFEVMRGRFTNATSVSLRQMTYLKLSHHQRTKC